MTGEDYEARKDEHRPDWPGYMTDHLPECMTPDDPCADPESCDSLACSRERLHLTLRDEADQREGHLPECGQYCDGKPPKCRGGDCTLCDEVDCICTALRACEQRVRQDMALQYLVSDREQQEAEQRAYAAGLAAARDAVAGLPWDNSGAIDPVDALAAIDALRGEA